MRRAAVAGCALLAALTLVTAVPGAAQSVTLFADRTTLDAVVPVRLRGAIDPGRAGETVEIEVKDCGQPSFRQVAGTATEQGGQWAVEYRPGISTTVRAAWKGQRSAPVAIQQRAPVAIRKRSGARFEVWVWAKVPFWHKRATIQRRSGGAWKTLREVLLTDQRATGGDGGIMSSATFRAPIPRGTLVRAVVPISQARPCYLAGVSLTQRA